MDVKQAMINLVNSTQLEIEETLSQINGNKAIRDPWVKEHLGKGLTIIFPEGEVFEKGGVNTSQVSGPVFEDMLKMMKVEEKDRELLTFFATGVSLVMHPISPMVPTVHMNYRYFEITKEGTIESWFFGGGADLSPSYFFEEDAVHFHKTLKAACDTEDSHLYSKLKKDCDDYFFIPHRKEHRGVGGIFCMRRNDKPPEQIFRWAEACAQAFLPSYVPIVQKRKDLPYEKKHREWQSLRRGRYAEFNLVYDVGTSFGLKSKGNAESILMSLPPHAAWQFNAPIGPEEQKMQDAVMSERDWV